MSLKASMMKDSTIKEENPE